MDVSCTWLPDGLDSSDTNLFDSIELLEDIDLGDIDLSLCTADKNLENSDSDSGISACENNTQLKATSSDFILTDAIGDCNRQQDAGLNIFRPPDASKPSAPLNCATNGIAPIKILTVSKKTFALNPSHKIIPVHTLKKSTGSTLLSQNFGSSSTHCLNSSVLQLKCEDSTFADNSLDLMETDTLFPKYDPNTHPDFALGMHLRQLGELNQPSPVSGKSQPRRNASMFTRTPSPYFLTTQSGDCILTQANLERMRKRQERMVKNRHAASISRLRKKEYLEKLEMRYEQLKRENLQLWRQNEEWRARCEHLESSLSDLQSQINSVNSNQAVQANVPTNVRQSVPGAPRTSASSCTFSTTPSRPTGQGSMWPVGESSVSSDKGYHHDTKTAPSTVFYTQQSRSNLISLKGMVSRHQPAIQLNSVARPKVFATTSLLGICCLIALNVFLPPLNFSSNLGHRVSSNQLQPAPSSALRYATIGQRTLFSVSDAKRPVINTSDEASLRPICPNNVPLNNSPCSSMGLCLDNASYTDSGHAWQQWVLQNNRMDLNSPWDSKANAMPATQRNSQSSVAVSKFRVSLLSKSSTGKSRPKKYSSKKLASKSNERSLLPFYVKPSWNWNDLLEAAGRRNDTVYLILSRLDSMYLHAVDPVYDKLTTKLTLIVPAYPYTNNSNTPPESDHTLTRRTMLQVECDLRNVTLIYPPGIPRPTS